jgi:hypothetical protein
MAEISVDLRLPGFADRFIGHRPRNRDNEIQMDYAIRELVTEFVGNDVARGTVAPWSPRSLLFAHDMWGWNVADDQIVVSAIRLSESDVSTFSLGLDRIIDDVINVSMVLVTEHCGATEDRYDPVGFKWHANRLSGVESVVWLVMRERRWSVSASRPLGSTGPWSGALTGEYRKGEPFPPSALVSVEGDPRLEAAGSGGDAPVLTRNAVLTVYRRAAAYADLESAFLDTVGRLPLGTTADPGRDADSRLG